jgi:hypothetical protein
MVSKRQEAIDAGHLFRELRSKANQWVEHHFGFMTTLLSTHLSVDRPSLGRPGLSQHDVLWLTIDWPDNDSVAPSEFDLSIFLTGCSCWFLYILWRSTRSPLPMTVWPKINFQFATKKKIWLSCIRFGRHFNLRSEALINLKDVILPTVHIKLISAVLGWASLV